MKTTLEVIDKLAVESFGLSYAMFCFELGLPDNSNSRRLFLHFGNLGVAMHNIPSEYLAKLVGEIDSQQPVTNNVYNAAKPIESLTDAKERLQLVQYFLNGITVSVSSNYKRFTYIALATSFIENAVSAIQKIIAGA